MSPDERVTSPRLLLLSFSPQDEANAYLNAIKYYSPFVMQGSDSLLSVKENVLANLCVAYIMTTQNEVAEELMRRIEREEEALAYQGAAPDAAQPLHHCIVNLVIGTLYCSKGNFEFGISRVIRSLEPYNKKLEADTWCGQGGHADGHARTVCADRVYIFGDPTHSEGKRLTRGFGGCEIPPLLLQVLREAVPAGARGRAREAHAVGAGQDARRGDGVPRRGGAPREEAGGGAGDGGGAGADDCDGGEDAEALLPQAEGAVSEGARFMCSMMMDSGGGPPARRRHGRRGTTAAPSTTGHTPSAPFFTPATGAPPRRSLREDEAISVAHTTLRTPVASRLLQVISASLPWWFFKLSCRVSPWLLSDTYSSLS